MFSLGLFHPGGSQRFDGWVLSQSHDVMDVVFVAPAVHFPSAKTGIGPEDDFDLGPSHAQPFDEQA